MQMDSECIEGGYVAVKTLLVLSLVAMVQIICVWNIPYKGQVM